MSKLLILFSCYLLITARTKYFLRSVTSDENDGDNIKREEEIMHPRPRIPYSRDKNNKENFADYWRDNAQKTLKKIIAEEDNLNTNEAKNVILFMGDGMSFQTLAATRVYMGDENLQLAFEKFPYTAISKTYCVDAQVPDSACTSTAYLGGVKGNFQTIGVTASVKFKDCQAMTDTANHVHTIAQWAQLKGKSTGLVTTARVTHASPAGVFAHTANRRWETDSDVKEDDEDPSVCTDIATQLITGEVGKKLNVIMGGGRTNFLPKDVKDEEGNEGRRSDNINLIDKWKQLKKNEKALYIWNRAQLLELNTEKTDYVLGLLHNDHIPFHLERKYNDPSLSEMVTSAIKVLSKNKKGYFLFVEGGRIDMAHHYSLARLALDECAEFSRSIDKAVSMTKEQDTLIVATADHAHAMTMTGYPPRNYDIFGMAEKDSFNLTFTTINYVTGPGYKPAGPNESRYVASEEELENKEYTFPTLYHSKKATHGGDDVGVYAKGPWAHLFRGVIEENVIPHLMAYASCIGKHFNTSCENR